jgi:hypothetical protein
MNEAYNYMKFAYDNVEVYASFELAETLHLIGTCVEQPQWDLFMKYK